MADDKVELDLVLKRLSDLEKVPKALNDSTRAAEALLKQFQAIDGTVVSLASLTNSIQRSFSQLVKAVPNLNVARLARERQTNSSSNVDELDSQIQAQRIRYSQKILDGERLYGAAKASSNKIAAQELATLEKLLADKEAILLAEKQSESTNKRLLTIQEQINRNVSQYRVAKQTGDSGAISERQDQLSRSALLIDRQRLVVEQTRLKSEGEYTAELARQEARLSKLYSIQAGIKASPQDVAPRVIQPVDQASLFKVQSQLLVNYALMSQTFKLIGFGTDFVLQFDKSMTELAAITQTTNTEMETFSKTLIDVSQGSKFTAVEVAKAATIMGQAGFSTREIGAALPSIIKLATATGSDLTQAVDVATSTLTIFNLQASETAHVADVLTGALNLSKLDIQKLASGIQYAGNTAAEMGLNLEELVSTLGALSNAGIRSGSTLGTGLRQLLIELQKPTKAMSTELAKFGLNLASVDVPSQGLTKVLTTLKTAGFGASEAFKAFDVRAASTFITLSSNIDTITEMQTALTLSNAATEANDRQMGSLANTVSRFESSLGVLINSLAGPLKSALILVTGLFTKLLNLMNEFPTLFAIIGTAFLGLFASTVIVRVGTLIGQLIGIPALVTAIGTAAGGASVGLGLFNTAINFLFKTPIGLIATGITLVVGAMEIFNATTGSTAKAIDKLQAAVNESSGAFTDTQQKIESVDNEVKRLLNRYDEFKTNSSSLKAEVIALQSKFGLFSAELASGAITNIDKLIEAMGKLRSEFSGLAADQAAKTISDKALLIQKSLQQQGVLGQQGTSNFSGSTSNPFNDRVYAADPRLQGNINNINNANSLRSNTQQGLAILGGNFDASTATDAQTNAFLSILTGYKARLIAQQTQLNKDATELEKSSDKSINGLQETLDKNRQVFDQISQTSISIDENYARILGVNDDKRKKLIAQFEASPTNKLLTDQIENYKKDVADIATKLRSAKTDKEKTSIIADLKEKVQQIDAAIARYAENSAGGVLEQVLKAFPSFSVKDAIVAVVGDQSKLAEVKADAEKVIGDATGSLGKATKDFFDKTAETQKLAIERLKRDISHSADDFKNKQAGITSVVSETQDQQRGGLRGVYSDTELSILQDKSKALATDGLKAQISKTEELLPVLQELVDHQKELYDKAQAKHLANPEDRDAFKQAITTERDYNAALEDQKKIVNDLVQQKAQLNAELGIETEAHVSLGDQLQYSIDKYLEINRIQNDFALNINKNVTQVLDAAGNGFSQFVTNVATGSKSVGESFKDMAKSIISSMLDIASKSVASQALSGLGSIFGSILGSVFGATAGTSTYTPGTITTGPIAPATGVYTGGYIKRYASGGDTGRDSHLAMLRSGEYVLRRSAVDMIGKDTLDQLNAAGNTQASKSSGNISTSAASSADSGQLGTPVNVYVVSPDAKPSIGPKDVVAIMSEDIARGGQSIKLIKSVLGGRA